MANNPYVNQVVYSGHTLIDLRGDTVNASVLGEGYTAHDRSGAPITGTAQIMASLSYSPLKIPGANPASVQGGYAVWGNLVIINVYFETAAIIRQNNSIFSGAPSPMMSINFDNQLKRSIVLNPGGAAYLIDLESIPAGTVIYGTCVYLKA